MSEKDDTSLEEDTSGKNPGDRMIPEVPEELGPDLTEQNSLEFGSSENRAGSNADDSGCPNPLAPADDGPGIGDSNYRTQDVTSKGSTDGDGAEKKVLWTDPREG